MHERTSCGPKLLTNSYSFRKVITKRDICLLFGKMYGAEAFCKQANTPKCQRNGFLQVTQVNGFGRVLCWKYSEYRYSLFLAVLYVRDCSESGDTLIHHISNSLRIKRTCPEEHASMDAYMYMSQDYSKILLHSKHCLYFPRENKHNTCNQKGRNGRRCRFTKRIMHL